ncbi:ER-resident thioredoxin protein [Pelomyxa schiedti]|nr:ER-resident thioredoxin protein [Pelomyxa schiedti]
MSVRSCVIAVIVFAVSGGVFGSGLYDKNSGVVSLTKDEFGQKVFGSPHVWLVEFYAPWCGHCKALAPEYVKAAQNLHGLVEVGAVNCDEQKELCGAFEVQGFPTIKIFGHEPKKAEKGLYKEPIDYNGPRTAAGLANTALSYIPDFVSVVTSGSEDGFFAKNKGVGKVLLFSEKDKPANLYKSLAVDFGRVLKFGLVKSTNKELVEKYQITKFPTLIITNENDETLEIFKGNIAHAELYPFILKYAESAYKQQQGNSEGSEKAQAETNDNTWDVIRVMSNDDLKHCLTKPLCSVAVFDPFNFPDEQDEYEDRLQKVSEKFKGRVQFSWFGALEQPDIINTFHLHSGFPAVVLISNKKSVFSRYVGPFTIEGVEGFISGFLMGSKSASFSDLPKELPEAKEVEPRTFYEELRKQIEEAENQVEL